MRPPLTTTERLRRSVRDRLHYRRRHLDRRVHGRFRTDFGIVPHVFLARGSYQVAVLQREAGEVLEALGCRVIWTLDTAARLACGRGFLVQRDLTGYARANVLDAAAAEGLVGPAAFRPISIDPVLPRPPALIIRIADAPPASLVTPSGLRVVTWGLLVCDLLGTLGWRADILARVDGPYPGSPGRVLNDSDTA
jgi:hypothetical protein